MANFFPNIMYGDILTWIIIVAAVLIGTKIVAWLIEKFIKVLTKKTKTTLDDKLLDAFEGSMMTIAVVLITYLAARDLQYFQEHGAVVKTIFLIIAVFGGASVLLRFIKAVISWYAEEIANKTETELDNMFIPIIQKMISIIVYIVAALISLDKLGISITPILASLGIASLAIALALKDTLAEFFAGFYLMADESMKKGDLVKLDNGEEGFVEDIGWRTSRIRTYPNNLLIIPNTKLANSILQNFESPAQDTSFAITGGVSYEADLEKTEKILMKVAKDIMKNENASKDFEPAVRFSSFGDSNIDFKVILSSKTYPDRLPIIHEFIKRTKAEFDKAGIEMNYPARKIYYSQDSKSHKRKQRK